ncbi:signal peptidase II [Pseudoruegeria sp. HB172150]|uniref:signal peptidase II n=1 Tax=Pseudoruegeria sp. HB172150 TaxID=2721164 RepID=UPI001557AEA0|nr:signal peptidase II [Pseudoruegeria sp. HB172150]
MRSFWITAAIVFVLDQATKMLVLYGLHLDDRQVVEVLPPLLTFQMAWNYGINFGLFSGSGAVMRWVLIAVALAISAWVVWWMRRESRMAARISGGLLVGGALGNVIDRLVYGAVADFLNMSCCGIDNPFSFNVADVAIFLGAVGLILFTAEKKKTP